MSEQILLPGFSGDVVLVDGLCYEFTGWTTQPPEELEVTALFNTCEECGPSSSGTPEEISSTLSPEEMSSTLSPEEMSSTLSSMFSSEEMSSMFSSEEMSSMFSSEVDEESSSAVDEESSSEVDEESSSEVDEESSSEVDEESSSEVDEESSSEVDEESSSGLAVLYTLCPSVPVRCTDCDPQLAATYNISLSGLISPWSNSALTWNGSHTVNWNEGCPVVHGECSWGATEVPGSAPPALASLTLYWDSLAYPGRWSVRVFAVTFTYLDYRGGTDPCDPRGSYGSHFACSSNTPEHCDNQDTAGSACTVS